jgi:hypothetical protein
MKQRFIVHSLSILFLLCACNSNSGTPGSKTLTTTQDGSNSISDTSNYTTIQWLDSIQNFGKVTDGEKVLISFHFINTGNKPLIISDVKAGCGCTVPEKPEAPIQPGEKGLIKAEFNSSGRVGQVSKTLTITCNTTRQTYTLLFEGEVTEKKQSQ